MKAKDDGPWNSYAGEALAFAICEMLARDGEGLETDDIGRALAQVVNCYCESEEQLRWLLDDIRERWTWANRTKQIEARAEATASATPTNEVAESTTQH